MFIIWNGSCPPPKMPLTLEEQDDILLRAAVRSPKSTAFPVDDMVM